MASRAAARKKYAFKLSSYLDIDEAGPAAAFDILIENTRRGFEMRAKIAKEIKEENKRSQEVLRSISHIESKIAELKSPDKIWEANELLEQARVELNGNNFEQANGLVEKAKNILRSENRL